MEFVKKKLAEGKLVLGSFAKLPSPAVAEIMTLAGFDFVVVDFEPGAIGIETAENMVRAVQAAGGCPLARVAENSPALIAQALELGVGGVHVPMVESRADAEKAVRATRFPPAGDRPKAGAARSGRYGFRPAEDYFARADAEEVLLVVHIESGPAVENLAEIVSVPGIDVAYVGPNDLTQSLDLKGPGAGETLSRIYRDVALHLKNTNVVPGIFVKDPAAAEGLVAQGYRYLAYSSDVNLLRGATAKAVETFSGLPGRGR
ncbi:MAG: 2,4-dihydroxyhept-2-ene-1,7-dioic acid aldolase [Bacillota bacterium]|nr:MAG: 2,4-dihydroxyhept-2-ene-1,7-dioic acid aldolase [Bacillota bacterium]